MRKAAISSLIAIACSMPAATALAEGPIYVVRPHVPGITAGVLPEDAFAPATATPEHPDYAEDWSKIPRDEEGFIFKSPGYMSSPGDVESAPIRIAFGRGDLEVHGSQRSGTAYRWTRFPLGPNGVLRIYGSPESLNGSQARGCNSHITPYSGGPRNIHIEQGFDYAGPPHNDGGFMFSLSVSYFDTLTHPIKLGIRVICDDGLMFSGYAPPADPGDIPRGRVEFTQDFEVTYTP